jgi:hypothetical protein
MVAGQSSAMKGTTMAGLLARSINSNTLKETTMAGLLVRTSSLLAAILLAMNVPALAGRSDVSDRGREQPQTNRAVELEAACKLARPDAGRVCVAFGSAIV